MQYDNLEVTTSQPLEDLTKPTAEKTMDLWFNNVLNKDKSESLVRRFFFYILSQLANNLASITLYEQLRLSKATRDALGEALIDVEVFHTQVPSIVPEEEQQSLQISMPSTRIIFTLKDMQVMEKHDMPLYFSGYLGSTDVNRILVDSRSALSKMPRQVMLHLGIPASWPSSTVTTIYGFNANGTCLLGKIKLRFQI